MKFRLLASIFFLILIIFPISLLKSHINYTLDTRLKAKKETIRERLIDESNKFQNNLIPEKRLEAIFHEIERELGLSGLDNANVILTRGTDPKLINIDFIPKLKTILKDKYDIEPLCIVSSDCDFHNFFHYFSEKWSSKHDTSDVEYTKELKDKIAKTIAIGNINGIRSFLKDDSFLEKFRNLQKAIGKKKNDSQDSVKEQQMRRHFSKTYYPSYLNRQCIAFTSRKIGVTKTYLYENYLEKHKSYAGAYSVILSDVNFGYRQVLNIALRDNNGLYKKTITQCPDLLIGQTVEENNKIYHISSLPVEMQISSKIKVFGKKAVIYYDLNSIQNNHNSIKQLFNLIINLFYLLLIFVLIRYVLFGFQIKSDIKKRIILIVSLMLLLPYAALGYFSALILQQIERASINQIESESKSRLFEFESLLNDLKLKRILYSLKFKLKTLPLMSSLNFDKLMHSRVLRHGGFNSAIIVNHIAETKRINYKSYINFENIPYLIAIGLLNDLNALDKTKKTVRDAYKKSTYLSGMSGSFDPRSKNLFDSEIREMKSFTNFSDKIDMTMALIPDSKKINTIKGLAFLFFDKPLNTKSLLSYVFENNFHVFTSKSNKFNTRLGIGIKNTIDEISYRTLPSNLQPNDILFQVIQKTINKRDSGFKVRSYNKEKIAVTWSSNFSKFIGISAITTLNKDLFSAFLIKIYPLILIVISIISIFLLSDILSIILTTPLTKLVKIINLIRKGDYNTRVVFNSKDEFLFLGNALNAMSKGFSQREKMKRFVSGRLFEKIKKEDSIEDFEKTKLVVLSSDIRDFTTLSENYHPEEIVALLNDYFTIMEKVIIRNNGIIEKFIGDAIIAAFYKSDDTRENCINSINAAFEMQNELAKLNFQREQNGKFCIANGIGIKLGEAVAGIVGSKSGRSEFTILGEIVNLADKLEATSKFTKKSKIVICKETKDYMGNEYDCMKIDAVRDIEAYEVITHE